MGWRVARYGHDPCPCAAPYISLNMPDGYVCVTVNSMGDHLLTQEIPNPILPLPPDLRSKASPLITFRQRVWLLSMGTY